MASRLGDSVKEYKLWKRESDGLDVKSGHTESCEIWQRPSVRAPTSTNAPYACTLFCTRERKTQVCEYIQFQLNVEKIYSMHCGNA